MSVAVLALTALLRFEDVSYRQDMTGSMDSYVRGAKEGLVTGHFCRFDAYDKKECGFRSEEYCRLTLNEVKYPSAYCAERR